LAIFGSLYAVHEYSIVGELISRVETEARAHGATSVQRLQVRIGELAGVETELLASAYAVFREKTICRDAELEIHSVPAHWVCPQCQRSISRGEVLRCSACQLPARLESGDEIILDRIEMEVA
jgi:hydrogenase nickel incorporation protein HypA/HybF